MGPKRTKAEKARRAAAHPERPGEQCDAAPGSWTPVVNRARCEAKSDCVEVCPYGVFEVRGIDEEDYRALSLPARLKVFFHGKRSAYTPNAGACRACGLCVVACPEGAIRIVRTVQAA